MNEVYDTDNIIDVFFEHDGAQPHHPSSKKNESHSTYVTNISAAAKKQLFEALASKQPIQNSRCIERLSMQYNERLSMGTEKRCCLTIEPLWSNLSKKPLACLEMQNIFHPRMKQCACNLRAGKCRDEFMRNIIGTVLFPQFYATNKQK